MISESQSRKFCRDDISKIENYDKAINDKTQTWDLHHRLELTLDGEFALTAAQLKMHDMYYNRPYYELIFLTRSEHIRMHNLSQSSETREKRVNSLIGHSISEETRRKISEAAIRQNRTGKNNPMYGKHPSEETRRKISEANKGKLKGISKSIEHRRKISESAKRRWAAIKK